MPCPFRVAQMLTLRASAESRLRVTRPRSCKEFTVWFKVAVLRFSLRASSVRVRPRGGTTFKVINWVALSPARWKRLKLAPCTICRTCIQAARKRAVSSSSDGMIPIVYDPRAWRGMVAFHAARNRTRSC